MQERALKSWNYDEVDYKSIRLVEQVMVRKPSLVSVPSLVANDLSNVRPKRYKAFFKHLTDQEKAEFKSQRCVVFISLGQPYMEGKKLEALLKLIDRSFASCTIVVGDLLHRYFLEIADPSQAETERIEASLRMGEEWMLRNGSYVNQLSISYNVTSWKDWTIQPAFQMYKSTVEALYANDKGYKTLCDSIINQFLSRAESRRSNWALSFNASLKYLMEENAVFCLWAEAGYDVEIYPSLRKENPVRSLTEYTSTKIDVMKNYKAPIVAIERR